MNEWIEIRRGVLVEHVSKRSVCAEYGLGWETLPKILANPDPPGCRKAVPRRKGKLADFTGVIDEVVRQDRDPWGAGKSHLATRLALAACAKGYKVRLFRVTQLTEARDERNLQKLQAQLEKWDLILLDLCRPRNYPDTRAAWRRPAR